MNVIEGVVNEFNSILIISLAEQFYSSIKNTCESKCQNCLLLLLYFIYKT